MVHVWLGSKYNSGGFLIKCHQKPIIPKLQKVDFHIKINEYTFKHIDRHRNTHRHRQRHKNWTEYIKPADINDEERILKMRGITMHITHEFT